MREPNAIAADLIATGLSAGQMALLLELTLSLSADIPRTPVESREETAAERRLKKDRERKRRSRLAKIAAAKSAADSVRGHSAETADTPCSLKGEERGLAIEVLVKKESKRGIRLSASAVLSDADRAFAETLIAKPLVDQCWAEFVDYWIGVPGSRGTKLDWSATWRNRVREIAPRVGKIYGNGAGGNRANSTAGRATANEAAYLTSMGKGALGQLEASRAARSDGDVQNGTGAASFADAGARAKASG